MCLKQKLILISEQPKVVQIYITSQFKLKTNLNISLSSQYPLHAQDLSCGYKSEEEN